MNDAKLHRQTSQLSHGLETAVLFVSIFSSGKAIKEVDEALPSLLVAA